MFSGEKTLREKQEKIKKAKIEAKKAQKQKRREEIVNEEVKLEEDVVPKQKVVQNIKLFEWTAPDRTPVKFEKKSFLIDNSYDSSFFLILSHNEALPSNGSHYVCPFPLVRCWYY